MGTSFAETSCQHSFKRGEIAAEVEQSWLSPASPTKPATQHTSHTVRAASLRRGSLRVLLAESYLFAKVGRGAVRSCAVAQQADALDVSRSMGLEEELNALMAGAHLAVDGAKDAKKEASRIRRR